MTKNTIKKSRWEKVFLTIQNEFEKWGGKMFPNNQTPLNKNEQMHIQKLHDKIKNNIYSEIGSTVENKTKTLPGIKEIILYLEVVPFQFSTRSNPLEELGKPWRHDGGKVMFSLQIPHDRLEIFSLKGEFIRSFPVLPSGEVEIDQLDPGLYLLYLRGRKIASMQTKPSDE